MHVGAYHVAQISIHAPARGATHIVRCVVGGIHISIHAPARGATETRLPAPANIFISIHAPARGATLGFVDDLSLVVFQSTLPQGERQRIAWGVALSTIISIHAPARGATLQGAHCAAPDTYFNPRSRKGSDDKDSASTQMRYISIHAPARGATPSTLPPLGLTLFQSTLPQGERLISRSSRQSASLFQSTLPQGERQPLPVRFFGNGFISIHAPARGATAKINKKA